MSLSRNSGKLRVFAACLSLPQPDKLAGDRRFVAMLELLAKKHAIDLCVFYPDKDLSASQEAEYRKRFARIGVRLMPLSYKYCDHITASLYRADYDLGLFEFYGTTSRLAEFREICPNSKAIVDSVDVHFVREQAADAFGFKQENSLEDRKAWELAAYRSSDRVIAVSSVDEAVLNSFEGMPACTLIPIIIPTRPRVKREREREVLFIGGFNHAPNLDGIVWFVETIWPQVKAAVPDAKLTVVGSSVSPEVSLLGSHPGVEIVGFVPETEPYLDRAAVSIAPLRFGAGMKGKVCEAMSAGLPVVTTSFGSQGLGGISREHYIEEDSPDHFAGAIIALLQDPILAERIGLNGQDLIAKLCGPDVVEKRLYKMVDELAPAFRKGPRTKPRLRYASLLVRGYLWHCRRSLKQRIRGTV